MKNGFHRNLLAFWAASVVNGVLFFSSFAEDIPLTPSNETDVFDLKVNGKVVAKIQGHLEWRVNVDEKVVTFSLPNDDAKNVRVRGNQNSTDTEFELSWTQDMVYTAEDGKSNVQAFAFLWKATFKKDADRKVSIDQSFLNYWLKGGQERVAVWKDPVQLVSKSDLAFNCSQLEIVNQKKDVLDFTEVKIQPFDLNDQEFGEDEICPRDQSTTTSAPTTIVPTTPIPRPHGNWTVSDNEKYTCIRLVGDITLNVKYNGTDGQNLTANVPIPIEAAVGKTSTCNYNFTSERVMNDEQILQLEFDVRGHPWLFTVKFTNNSVLTKDNSRQTVLAYYVGLKYFTDAETFENITNPGEKLELHNDVNKTGGQGALAMFRSSDQSHYYRCNTNDTTDVVHTFSVTTQNLKVEAFLPNSTDFLKEQVCPSDVENEPVDWVPIIIGAALTALVVFVLIAYLVGRHRAKASTYETI